MNDVTRRAEHLDLTEVKKRFLEAEAQLVALGRDANELRKSSEELVQTREGVLSLGLTMREIAGRLDLSVRALGAASQELSRLLTEGDDSDLEPLIRCLEELRSDAEDARNERETIQRDLEAVGQAASAAQEKLRDDLAEALRAARSERLDLKGGIDSAKTLVASLEPLTVRIASQSDALANRLEDVEEGQRTGFAESKAQQSSQEARVDEGISRLENLLIFSRQSGGATLARVGVVSKLSWAVLILQIVVLIALLYLALR